MFTNQLSLIYKIFIILFFFSVPLYAETIQRQAYKVCKTNEEAYWNGSSAQCCDTKTQYTGDPPYVIGVSLGNIPYTKKLVKNYTTGQDTTSYACCPSFADASKPYDYEADLWGETVRNYQLAGSVNGSCCGVHTTSSLDFEKDGYSLVYTSSATIYQNGGVYYCAISRLSERDGAVYESASKVCTYYNGSKVGCTCSTSGDPMNGTPC